MNADPDMERFLSLLEVGEPFAAPADLSAFRAAGARRRAVLARGVDRHVNSHDFEIANSWGPLVLRVVIPEHHVSGPALLYFHGGGWSSGSNETHRPLIEAYAAASRYVVVAVDYALAPEAPFPAALWQGLSALEWLRAHAGRYGISSGDIAVGGDSAGANLALCLCLAAREIGVAMPAAMLLSYGSFDADSSRPSYALFGSDEYLLTPAKMRWFWDNYVPHPDMRRHPLVSPLMADLRGLPPVHLTIAARDILLDENVTMASALATAGVDVTISRHDQAVHAFLEAVDFASISQLALNQQVLWLGKVLNSSPSGESHLVG